MKYRLMELLACPECGGALGLEAWRTEQAAKTSETRPGCRTSCYFDDLHCRRCYSVEILEGALRCKGCPRAYPIIDGIPRMLPDDVRITLQHYHASFFERHPEVVPYVFFLGEGAPSRDDSASEKTSTLRSFSFQRVDLNPPDLRYRGDWLTQFDARIKPHAIGHFVDKLGLDAGCGFGRYSYAAHAGGAEVVGLDLSEGVSLAYKNNRENPRVHIVQGDIYRMPFRPAIFDFAFSFGVLHHLPDPQQGFQAIVRAARPEADIVIWVYGYKGMSLLYRLSHLRTLRRLTTHLPRSAQVAICAAVALVLEVILWRPYRILSAIPATSRFASRLPAQSNSRQPFRMKITAVFDRLGTPVTHFLNREELVQWYQEAGLSAVQVWSEDKRGWQACGKKQSVTLATDSSSCRNSLGNGSDEEVNVRRGSIRL